MHPENEKLIRCTEDLLSMVKDHYDLLIEKYGKDDFRVKYIGLTGNVFHSMLLNFAATTMTISIPEWWQHYYNRKPNEDDISAIQNLGQLTKHAFLVFYFSKVEAMMRKTINFLNPNFDPKGLKPLKQIYDRYLTILNLSEDIPLYDIARLLRNSIHSNGVFFSHTGTDHEIYWENKKYKFDHGKLINFITIDFTFYLYKELIKASFRIVNSDVYNNYNYIEDKYY